MTDAVVIGSGPNGLVAAALLADHGWSVQVLEAADDLGGACRSAEVTEPGFISDLFSAFYPLGLASPVLAGLHLEQYGLRWSHAPAVLAHPLLEGKAAVLSRQLDVTAADLGEDGEAWTALARDWQRLKEPLLDTLFTPFPPIRPAAGLLRVLKTADALRFARFATLPVRTFAEEQFRGSAGGLLLAGNSLHTDLGPDSASSAIFGWLLAMSGQDVGFPVPVGGAGNLTAAMAQRARAAGARIHTNSRVAKVVIRGGQARAVRLEDGTEVEATKAVIADVDAPQLYLELVGADALPPRLTADLKKFQWDNSTVKVDWALSAPIPWHDDGCRQAGTVHLGGSMDELSVTANQLARRLVPASPFVILGQMTTSDPTRSPTGTESAWAYFHVPQAPKGDAGGEDISGDWTDTDVAKVVARLEQLIERYAPGFGDLIINRHVQSPTTLNANNLNLHRGALNGGSAAIHQQLFFRPVPGLGRAETVIANLYLASMSAHPGGGVHGGAGANAARAAIKNDGVLGPIRRKAISSAHRAIYRPGGPL
jgi:phytoene dehydrogenase-like protein